MAVAGEAKTSALHVTPIVLLASVAAALVAALALREPGLAVYGLSFWHYYLYGLAFALRAIQLRAFRRDAMLAKAIALAAFAWAYLGAWPDPLSLLVVGAGFALNAWGAAVLGSERTYYGHELAGLPYAKVTRAPFSLTPHPMLLGNIVAYAGTLIDPGFRQDWWPLALIHILLNAGLLVMERAWQPPEPARLRRVILLAVAAAIGLAVAAFGAALPVLLLAPAWAGGAVAQLYVYGGWARRRSVSATEEAAT